jgi:hypothetical protein
MERELLDVKNGLCYGQHFNLSAPNPSITQSPDIT